MKRAQRANAELVRCLVFLRSINCSEIVFIQLSGDLDGFDIYMHRTIQFIVQRGHSPRSCKEWCRWGVPRGTFKSKDYCMMREIGRRKILFTSHVYLVRSYFIDASAQLQAAGLFRSEYSYQNDRMAASYIHCQRRLELGYCFVRDHL
jgi:hypothetical protein